jgi:hypothetical protein
VVEPGEDDLPPTTGLWQALRRDPAHASEIAVRHALPQLTPHVARWWSTTSRAKPSEPADRIARRVLRRSAGVARRGGLITGSSFYVGMLPAVAMIYCEQLVVVLRIAAAYGRDPADPLRAAEILMLQGRYDTVDAASAALRNVGARSPRRLAVSGPRAVMDVVRQVPSMIGLQVRKLRSRSPFEVVIGAAEVASFFVPVVSLPVWAFANAHATRRLGRRAIDFYRQPSAASSVEPPVVLPSRPPARTRRLVIATVVPFALALGVLWSYLPIGRYQHGRWIGLAIGEAALALTFARLIRLTRVPAPARA